MARENSFSDSDGRSLTPDLTEEEDNEHVAIPSAAMANSPESPISETTSTMFAAPTYASPTYARPIARFATETTVDDIKSGKVDTTGDEIPSRPSAGTSTASAPAGPSLPPSYPGTSTNRFRTAVRRVILSRRMSTLAGVANAGPGAGAEPGIDPRRASAFFNYGHLTARCAIEVMDYSGIRSSNTRMNNEQFLRFLEDENGAGKREPWAKVRWINIGGISWDVISSLSLRYGIHPLSLEDVLHQRPQARSKADYYSKHLFIRVLVHQLASEQDNTSDIESIDVPRESKFTGMDVPRTSSPLGFVNGDPSFNSTFKRSGECDHENEDAKEADGHVKSSGYSRHSGRFVADALRHASFFGSKPEPENGQTDLERVFVEEPPQSRKRGSKKKSDTNQNLRHQNSIITERKSRKAAANAKTIEELKRGQRVNVRCTPFFLFLYRDGTVISISPTENLKFTEPITARLRQRDTSLRSTADPSMLIQSLLDLVVDQALEVIDEYERTILDLEHDILIRPKVKTVRSLHIISGDLTLHKRTLQPVKSLVYGLRRYDVDRCNALVDSISPESHAPVEGFMSHKSKIYLADVHDHMDYVLSSLDMFTSVTENLINYTFNMSSSEMNETMRRLTLATIIFLPLTLLTGYFGMNFQIDFWSVQNNSDLFFWELAIPILFVVILIFMSGDIQRMFHFLRKRRLANKLYESVGLRN